MKKTNKAKAIIFDLDDTLIMSDATYQRTWREVFETYSREHPGIGSEELFATISQIGAWYWSDPERHRIGRNDMENTRRKILRMAFERMGLEDLKTADSIADDYSKKRLENHELFPLVYETLSELRRRGIALALLTNGEGRMQRAKIDKFKLAPYFECIRVEGEVGYGKPEEEAYLATLQCLDATADETWIVGDNIEWEVKAPQKLGIFSIWHDCYRRGLPEEESVVPDRIIHRIAEIAEY
ncbi:MAG: HAD family hydrolase [Proteobacteria bacterium]|nr:HAD family hydrolase [Pseudomonadota bacterium]